MNTKQKLVTTIIILAIAMILILSIQSHVFAKSHNPLSKVGKALDNMFNVDTDNCHQKKKSERLLCEENARLRQQLQTQNQLVQSVNTPNPLSKVGSTLENMFKKTN